MVRTDGSVRASLRPHSRGPGRADTGCHDVIGLEQVRTICIMQAHGRVSLPCCAAALVLQACQPQQG